MIPFTPPQYKKDVFTCPHCNSYAQQSWHPTRYDVSNYNIAYLMICFCSNCQKYSLWHYEKMIYPDNGGIMPPNPDLGEDIISDYNEASSIFNKSPRGAFALIRLCVQKLTKLLGEPGKNMNDDIASLVKKGLPLQIQQALDIIRVIGNADVYPGAIDLNDNPDMILSLFELINIVADVMITQPKKIKELYDRLPQTKKEEIIKRDSP
ncbi:DUF4145 domain-containing protein [Pelotomaculum sp. FP]|uniref:DUF4145 domain-containing protein n=1 Tax=Pelotomaculum sp. FP TaxID=261474 RepID=UPI0010662B96|nr:DUF4145 domain-containing protein [Pelotomaculum sp. FP]